MGMKTGFRGAARCVGAAVFLAAFAASAQFPSSQVLASTFQSSGSTFQSSGASSNASSAASGASNASSQASQSNQSTQSSADSTGAGVSTGVDRVASSWIIAGSAGLLTTAGAIVLTVYTLNAQRDARLRTETFRKSAPPALRPPVEATPLPPPGTPPPLLLAPPPATPTPPPLPEPERSSVSPPGAEPAFASMALARAWLLANRLQLQQDLALGAGPAIDELAGIAGIAPARRAHFGRVLARMRHRLLVAPGVSPAEASQALSAVGDAVLADPVLRPDAEALLASW